MLRIRITEIPRQGLHIDSKLSAELLNERIAKGEESEWRVTEDPEAHLQLSLERDSTEAGALLRGELFAKLEQTCRRCMGSLQSELRVPIDYIIKPARPDKKGVAFEEDMGLALFDGEWIELEELLQEALILAVDPLGAKHAQCKLPEGAQEASTSAVGSVSLGDFFRVAKVKRKE